MDFVNWVVSRVDEVMAQIDLNRGDDSRDIPRRVPERSAATGAVESPDASDAPSSRSAA
jgi:hypothetical protein